MARTIAVFGGSFNPIHNGHLQAAYQVLLHCNADTVLFVPAGIPPHKELAPGSPTAEDRLAMLHLAIADEPRFEVSDIEIVRECACYTYETMLQLQTMYPDCQLIFVMGSDMFFTLEQWYRFRDLVALWPIVVIARRPADYPAMTAEVKRLSKCYGANVIIPEATCVDVSSTAVRRLLAMGDTAGSSLSPAVQSYIRRKGLYRASSRRPDPQSEVERIIRELEERLPEKRFVHSLGVSEEAVRLAPRFGADEHKARIAGLLHDITKPLSSEEQLKLCQKFGIILTPVEQHEPKLLHAITGSRIAKIDFGIEDEEILLAIRYHTTARAEMTALETVLYLADFTEPNRDFPGVDLVRAAVERGNREGLLFALDFTIREIMSQGSPLHPDTIAARNALLLEEEAH